MTKEIPRHNFGIIKQGTDFNGFSLEATDGISFENYTALMTVREKNVLGQVVKEVTGTKSTDNTTFVFAGFKATDKPGTYVLDVVFTNTQTQEEEVFLEGIYKIDNRIKPQT